MKKLLKELIFDDLKILKELDLDNSIIEKIEFFKEIGIKINSYDIRHINNFNLEEINIILNKCILLIK
jgi:hypothetical protein